jgi:hypothetical protein
MVGELDIEYMLQLTSLSAPKLTTVTGGAMSGIVSGALYLANLPLLPSVSLPVLATVNGSLAVNSTTVLAGLSLPALAVVQTLVVDGNTGLLTLTAPALTSISKALEVAYNPQLPTCYVAKLVAAGHPPQVTNLGNNAAGICP